MGEGVCEMGFSLGVFDFRVWVWDCGILVEIKRERDGEGDEGGEIRKMIPRKEKKRERGKLINLSI